MLDSIGHNPMILLSEKWPLPPFQPSEKQMDLAIFSLGLHVHRFTMFTMNKHFVNIDANETVSTSQADEIDLVDATSKSTTIQNQPHVIRLQVPPSIQNITVSFEPKFQGPVTVEFSLTTMLPEDPLIANSSHIISDQKCVVNINESMNAITGEVKIEPADANQSATTGPGRTLPAAPIYALFDVAGNASPDDNHIKSTSTEPLTPRAPVIDNSETEPESQEGTPRLLEKVASELPVSAVPARGPHCPLKRSFTPDSFAKSEDIGSISTQFLRDRWAQIRENLIARQERYKPIFADTSPPPTKRSRK
ncbi:hypothetical protein BKA82DRAFT_22006 [Pisolithus tinctorius]|uniref:Uncharacterized protein n=1 Tax=Pisolithus tinctorius Marx 270 TaxID=870435 RepID=A0A0C3JK29_PISTI|nr:hypothetical protein BKA82DRAFT_22006 [Pisolithus tinctorius]KIO09498.1 hypothetical protein M404DRAFT_22006 [Pisolithus tinctorius Marx 270]